MMTLTDAGELPVAHGRFSALLSENCPKPIYDQALFGSPECVVTPTLGSILPNWLLVIPRRRFLNFAAWSRKTSTDPSMLVSSIAAQLDIEAKRIIWFEHGAASVGSTIGCGVEHAHLHLLIDAPFTYGDIVAEVERSSRLPWQAAPVVGAYSLLPSRQSYLLLSAGKEAVLSAGADEVGSQFFRRAVARLVGNADSWDYRLHPHLDNVRQTVEGWRAGFA